MTKSAVVIGLLLFCAAGCGPRSAYKPEKENPQIQLRISGTGLRGMRAEVYSKGPQQIGMFLETNGSPSQEMFFQNSDTIQYLFPIGKNNPNDGFDTTAISRNEALTFVVKIRKNTFSKDKSSREPNFKVELLADGELARTVQVPIHPKPGGKAAASDSTATISLNTSQL